MLGVGLPPGAGARSGCRGPREREFRRAVMRRLENVDMRVEFDPAMLPARIWWAI